VFWWVGPAPRVPSGAPGASRVGVALGGRRAARHEVEPRVTVPPGFSLERVDPPRVPVVLREVPTPMPSPTREVTAPEATPTPGG
jgi:hypothetical protein